jgi:hypothetical protein
MLGNAWWGVNFGNAGPWVVVGACSQGWQGLKSPERENITLSASLRGQKRRLSQATTQMNFR